MAIWPSQNRSLGLPRGLLVCLAILSITPHSLLAKDDQTKKLPPGVERVLWWLPEDTETLFVAQSVTMPEFEPEGGPNWQDFGASGAIGEGLEWDSGSLSRPLRGRRLECVVFGAKNFEGVGSFGSLRSENCSILVFEKDLGDAAREWTDGLRKKAKSVRTLINREVFVFPSTTAMEPWVRKTEWQATYLVLITPNILLCASSDRYLESVLRRLDNVPKARALPDDLPEWKRVDFDAPVWMLRHQPKSGRSVRIVGVTATFKKDSFRIVYVPTARSDQNLGSIKKSWENWLPKQELDVQGLRDRLKLECQPDGTVVVSFGGKPNAEVAGFAMQLYRLQAMELFEPND